MRAYKLVAVLIILALLLPFLPAPVPTKAQKSNELIIYTYEWFFGLSNESLEGKSYEVLFQRFEQMYGVKVKVVFFDGARNAFLRALNEKKAGVRTADLILGVDNIIVQEGKKEGLFAKIDLSKLENASKVRSDLFKYLDPPENSYCFAVPYDFGPIAFIYDSKRINITELKFEDFYNTSLAEKLVLEDPTQSSVGLSFLAWQIGVYEKLLKKNWKEWWKKVKDYVDVQPSWGDAYYGVFLDESKGRPIVVSYLTSPICHYLYEGETRYKPMLVKYDGQWWAWFQVQGAAIVKGSPMEEYAYKFIDWLLSDEVQNLTYSDDIMLPASEKILNSLPEDIVEVMGFNISEVKAVNELLPPSEVYSNVSSWLKDWEEIMRAPPTEVYTLALAIIVAVFAIGVAVYVVYYRRKFPKS